MTIKQKRFCEEYMVDFNATQAAIRAGYPEKTAKQIGYENLTKPYLRKFVDERLNKLSLQADEATKLISDIAKSNLNQYFTIKTVEYTPRIVKSVRELIEELKAEMDFEEEFSKEASLSEEELSSHKAAQQRRKIQILRYELELKRNPNASRICNGETVFIEQAELDMVRLVKDKDAGRIKSIKPTMYGLQVELYAADAALRDVAKMHGLFAKDNEQTKPVVNIDLTKEPIKFE